MCRSRKAGVRRSPIVILSAAKDLGAARRQILRCAQDDNRQAPFLNNLSVKGSPRLVRGTNGEWRWGHSFM